MLLKTVKDIFLPHKPDSEALKKTAYDFEFTAIDGTPLPLGRFRGKLLIIVNTASECLFTPQLGDLERLWLTYQSKGVVVLGVPSNDFGKQEPGSNQEVRNFCESKYQVSFPLTEKEPVTGRYAHPFYQWAEAVLGGAAAPKWNFHKYIISPEGALLDFFIPSTKPLSRRMVHVVEQYMPL